MHIGRYLGPVIWPATSFWPVQDLNSGAVVWNATGKSGKNSTSFYEYATHTLNGKSTPEEKKQLMKEAVDFLRRLDVRAPKFSLTVETLKDFQEGLRFCGLECLTLD